MLKFNECNVSLLLNNKRVDFLNNNLVSLRIIEAVNQFGPIAEISLSSDTRYLDKNPIKDRDSIQIGLEHTKTKTLPEQLKFKVFNYDMFDNTQGFNDVTLYCYVDSEFFMTHSTIWSTRGTTNTVAQQIASKSGFTFRGDPTSDTQSWISPGLSGAKFLDYITDHAYLNSQSYFVSCVTRTGELRFFNLNDRAAKDPTWNLSLIDPSKTKDIPDTTIPIYMYNTMNRSGLLNKYYGYGRELSTNNLQTDERSANRNVTFKKSTDRLQIRSSENKVVRYESTEFNTGNFHPNYFKSRVQNHRMRAVNSTKCIVESQYMKNIQLLDRVNLNLNSYDGDAKNKSAYDGHYFVSKIIQEIGRKKTNVIIELIREGINTTSDEQELS